MGAPLATKFGSASLVKHKTEPTIAGAGARHERGRETLRRVVKPIGIAQ